MNFLKGLTNDIQQSVSSVASNAASQVTSQNSAGNSSTGSTFSNATNSLLSASGNLFDSVKSKTGNLVNDFSTKVDLGNTIDTIKRRTSIDQFGNAFKGKDEEEIEIPQNTSQNCIPSKTSDINARNDPNNSMSQMNNSELIQNNSTANQNKIIRENPFASGETKPLSRNDSVGKPMPSRPPPPRGASIDISGTNQKSGITSFAGSRSTSMDTNNLMSNADSYDGIGNVISTPVAAQPVTEDPDEDEPFVDNDEDDSSASEYGGDSAPVYADIPSQPETVHSIDAVLAETVKEEPDSMIIQEFMDIYVAAVINGDDEMVGHKFTEFQRYSKTPAGRALFAANTEAEANMHGGHLGRIGLNQLLDHLNCVLSECQKAEDFVPAKKLLTTSLLYYFDDDEQAGERKFLFSYIKSQPIWHTLRFWNACFFQSVQEVRAKVMDQHKSPQEVDAAISKQLRSYLNTMHVFSLHTNIRMEFLRKQGDLFNLSQTEINAMKESILQSQTE